MACATATACAVNATCVERGGGYTCLCKDGFSGNGFTKCTSQTSVVLEEDFIYIVVLIVLLFVGLIVIFIFFVCRRRILDKSQEEPLVTSLEDQYDMKWQMVLAGTDKDVPPPYTDISVEKQEPGNITTFFTEPELPPNVGDEGRVTVEADEEDFVDEVDAIKDYDNPTYDTVVTEDDVSAATTPEETDDDLERAVIGKVYENPSFEKDEPVTESVPEVEPEEVVDPEPVEEIAEVPEEPIKITFEETETNTVTATVTTPSANLTINLNINLPETAEV